jgi:hypothetical protein
VRLDELLDLGRIRPAFQPRDGLLAFQEDERRHPAHVESLRELGLLVDVDAGHLKPMPLLPRELREQAVHAPGRAGSPGGEEDEEIPTIAAGAPGAAGHRASFSRPGERETPSHYTENMGDWYSVGVFAGLGVALGIVAAAVLAGRRMSLAAPFLGAAVGIVLGVVFANADEAAGGGVGGLLGAAGTLELVRGALGRGGTRVATGLLVALGAVLVAALAFIPGVGYVEAIVLPALGARLRRRGGKRYAGLRSLARD